jgi:hypothetical protein
MIQPSRCVKILDVWDVIGKFGSTDTKVRWWLRLVTTARTRAVPRVETNESVDVPSRWTVSLPNWNRLSSTPQGNDVSLRWAGVVEANNESLPE